MRPHAYFQAIICLMGLLMLSFSPAPLAPAGKWHYLLDAELSQWDIFMGVPHYSLSLEGFEKGDGKKGTPIGLHKDPLQVFTIQMENGEPVLQVSGEIFGGISTKQPYENYHLSLQFKFGEEKFAPRLHDKRDSGLLYHGQEPHGQFWNVWLRSQELQIQETDCGDYHALAGVSMDIRAVNSKEGHPEFWHYTPEGAARTFQSRCRKSTDYENPHGEWSTIELVCLGDKAYHIVNGKLVMVLENSRQYIDGVAVPLTSGKIQLQSEGAALAYRDIKIRSISKLPAKFRRQLK